MTTLEHSIDPSRQQGSLADRITTLTRREAEVLEHLVKGLSNDQIALELYRSSKTIDKHCQNIYRKTRIHKRADLVRQVLGLRGPSRANPMMPSVATDAAVDSLLRKSRAWDKLKRFESILSRSSGVDYFGNLTRSLAETFGVRMAGISEVHAEEGFGVIIAYCVNGELQTPYQYALTNSVCGVVHREGILEQFENLADRFAGENCMLVELGFQSYVGVRLEDHLMGPIGTLWIADDKPMDPEDMPLAILKLFAPSAAAQLATQIALDNLAIDASDDPGS